MSNEREEVRTCVGRAMMRLGKHAPLIPGEQNAHGANAAISSSRYGSQQIRIPTLDEFLHGAGGFNARVDHERPNKEGYDPYIDFARAQSRRLRDIVAEICHSRHDYDPGGDSMRSDIMPYYDPQEPLIEKERKKREQDIRDRELNF